MFAEEADASDEDAPRPWLLCAASGVWKTGTIQRRPEDERWTSTGPSLLQEGPHSREERDEKDRPWVAVLLTEQELLETVMREVEIRTVVPRNFALRPRYLQEFGCSAERQ